MKVFSRCNYSPKSVNLKLIKRENILGGPALTRWKCFKEGLGHPSGVETPDTREKGKLNQF